MWKTTRSSGAEEIVQRRRALAVLDSIGDDPQRERFDDGKRFFTSLAIRENPRQRDDLSHPATIVFLLEFHPHRLGVHV